MGSTVQSYANYLNYLGGANVQYLKVFEPDEWKLLKENVLPMLDAYQSRYYSRNNTPAVSAVAFFNGQPYHGPAITLNAMDTALLQFLTGESGAGIQTRNYPLPPTTNDQIAEYRNKEVMVFDVPFTLLVGLSVLTSTFVLFLIKERVSKSKHLQVCTDVKDARRT